jgi:hypothetical protein
MTEENRALGKWKRECGISDEAMLLLLAVLRKRPFIPDNIAPSNHVLEHVTEVRPCSRRESLLH